VVGLGSRGPEGITLEARGALARAGAVFGYGLYLEQARPYIAEGVEVSSSGMTAETRRAKEALDLAMTGKVCAMVSGGDAGVYAMAGVVYEVAAGLELPLGAGPGELKITVVPGTPALCAGAALLGAPLTHDFCCISLSDRLTDWELIKKRLDMASRADFVIVIYNPRSRGRDWQLAAARDILLANLPGGTPVGLASRCGREGESATVVTLDTLDPSAVDMQTLVVVGNSTTFVYRGAMVTPRGYVRKYGSPDAKPDGPA
jgi:precorrin-3B C17-methyltransferase